MGGRHRASVGYHVLGTYRNGGLIGEDVAVNVSVRVSARETEVLTSLGEA